MKLFPLKALTQKPARFPLNGIAAVLLLSLLAKIVYLFAFSNYKLHLTSDMGAYWQALEHLLQGRGSHVSVWAFHSPLLPVYLFFVHQTADFFRAGAYTLELVLLSFIFYSTAASYFLYRIAQRVLGRDGYALLVTALYTFSFPVLYFSTFLLGLNLTVPAAVLAVYLVLYHPGSLRHAAFAGIIFALGIPLRPNAAFMAVPMVLYLVFHERLTGRSLRRGLAFSAGFFFMIFLFSLLSAHLSQGRSKTFSPHGGMTFFHMQCQAHSVHDPFLNYHTTAPQLSPRKEGGHYYLKRPFYEDRSLYREGLECIRRDPAVLVRNLRSFRDVFFGPMFPSFTNAAGFRTFFPAYRWLHFLMVLSLGLLLFRILPDPARFRRCLMLAGVVLFSFIPLYFYTSEPRYLMPALPFLYVAAFAVLGRAGAHKKAAFLYVLVLGTVLWVPAQLYRQRESALNEKYGIKHLQVYALDQAAEVKAPGTRTDLWGNFIFRHRGSGLIFKAAGPRTAAEMEISLDCDDDYRMDFYRGAYRLTSVTLSKSVTPDCGLAVRRQRLPGSVATMAFDRVLVTVLKGKPPYGIGHLRFFPAVGSETAPDPFSPKT